MPMLSVGGGIGDEVLRRVIDHRHPEQDRQEEQARRHGQLGQAALYFTCMKNSTTSVALMTRSPSPPGS